MKYPQSFLKWMSLIGLLAVSPLILAESETKNREVQKTEVEGTIVTGTLESNRSQSSQSRFIKAPEKVASTGLKKLRDPLRDELQKSLDFSIAYATVDLIYDGDYDGYYSEFELTFDADTNYNYANVYAELYLSRDGGPWELYHVTDVFEIQSFSASDYYSVTTLLNTGFPSGSYDLLIDLVDTYDNTVVSTYGPYDSSELAYLPLEDTTYEDTTSIVSEVSIFDAEIQLLKDLDADGFHQTYSIQFDADVDADNIWIYAEIWVRDSTGNWYLENTTEDFQLNGNSTLDTYILETNLESGYSTGYYDFRIEIYDAYSEDILADSEAFNGQLFDVPLEDSSKDLVSSNVNVTTPITTISVESGGAGSSGVTMLSLIALASLGRRLNLKART